MLLIRSSHLIFVGLWHDLFSFTSKGRSNLLRSIAITYFPLSQSPNNASLSFSPLTHHHLIIVIIIYLGAPNASGILSTVYRWLLMYMAGTPGIFLIRPLSSLSHVATMKHLQFVTIFTRQSSA